VIVLYRLYRWLQYMLEVDYYFNKYLSNTSSLFYFYFSSNKAEKEGQCASCRLEYNRGLHSCIIKLYYLLPYCNVYCVPVYYYLHGYRVDPATFQLSISTTYTHAHIRTHARTHTPHIMNSTHTMHTHYIEYAQNRR